ELEKQPPEKLSEPIVAAMIDGFSFLGQYEKVEKYAAQQSQDGQSITGRIALVEALLSQGKHDEAGALLKSLAAEHGDLAAVKLLLGRWQFHAGNYAEAEPALREAVASQPQHEGARLLLARTYIG